jgi:hypothetical protein
MTDEIDFGIVSSKNQKRYKEVKMMKTYLSLMCAIALLLAPTLGLAATTASVDVTAGVDEQLDLSVDILKVVGPSDDPWADGTEVQAMSYGSLTDTFLDGTFAGALLSNTWFTVFLIAKTSGRPYTIRQTANGLSSGTDSIPDNCYLMVPGYESGDLWIWPGGSGPQGDQPSGSTLGTAGPAKATNRTIYRSEDAGTSHIIRCYYTITNGYKEDGTTWPGFAGDSIPLDQPAGNYSGNVTFSLVLGN